MVGGCPCLWSGWRLAFRVERLGCAPSSYDVPFPCSYICAFLKRIIIQPTFCISAIELRHLTASSAPKQFHCRLSQSRRGSHCFFSFWFPNSCFNCCFPGSPCSFYRKSFSMAATLLNCSICPKQPTFSDTCHLLAHVSSKGHVSNLHKLQVRSYQEISAGHQLAAYNQWYQQHDLGRLLSERMLQKELKQTTNRGRATTSTRKIKKDYAKDAEIATSESQSFAVDPRLQQTPSTRPPRTPKVIAGTILQPDDESDFDLSPIKQQMSVFPGWC
jgi:hypothetical protein